MRAPTTNGPSSSTPNHVPNLVLELELTQQEKADLLAFLLVL